MSRPVFALIASQSGAWDGFVDGNFTKTAKQPFPIHESAALTEANVQSTFPAASFDRCFVWVNHSVIGYTLYSSDGTEWKPYGNARNPVRTVVVGGAVTTADKIVFYNSALGGTLTLPAAASWKGETKIFKQLGVGALTLDANSTELIDGALTVVSGAQYTTYRVYSDGTALWLL